MLIADTEQGNNQYITHTLTLTIGSTYVTVSKDGVSQTLNQ